MSFTITGGSIRTNAVKLTSTANTELLYADKRTVILSVLATNLGTGTPALTIELFDQATPTSYYLSYQVPMTSRGMVMLDSPFVLQGGWTLKATAGTAGQIDVLVNYLAPDATALGTFTPTGRA